MTKPQSFPDAQNPLLTAWTGPFGLPPLAAIKPEHFRPAFERAMAAHRTEIDAIAASPSAPSFDNTIEALEKSGRDLLGDHHLLYPLQAGEIEHGVEQDALHD